MPMKNIGKPGSGANIKTGFKLMAAKVARGTRPERPSAKGPIGANHQMVTAYARKKRPKMF